MQDDNKTAVKVLKNGGIVIFPTDTAYGIGCRMDDEKAVERLFRIRKRPETKATPVLVGGLEMAKKYWMDVPEEVVEKLIKPFWPGALTIVLTCKKEQVPRLVRGGGSTLGLRMPANQDLLQIIKEVGVPLIGTSANFAGEQTPFKFEDLDPELISLVDFVLPSKMSGAGVSTVIDCSGKPWKIIREGAIKIDLSI